MNLLIVTPNPPDNEATFIKTQISFLTPYKVLYSGYRPYLCENKSIFSFPLNINFIRIVVKRILPVLYSRIYEITLRGFLSDNKIDIVLCNYGPQSSNISRVCFEANVPLIASFYGYDAYIHKVLKKYRKKYTDLFKTAAAIISVSKDMSNQLVMLGAPREKVKLNPCGFDPSVYREITPEKNGKRLIFVGRLTEKKGPELLLHAFHKVLHRLPDAELIMIGNGELYGKVVSLIETLKVKDSVTLMLWQPPEVIARELEKSRAYVQHSRVAENGDSEGSPVSIIEAAGSGLPVISTRHAGIKETVVEGITGFLIDEGDWESMGDHMIELLENPELAGKMGRAGRQHILQHYSVNRQKATLLEIIQDIMIN